MGEIGNFWILLQRLNFGVSRNYFLNFCLMNVFVLEIAKSSLHTLNSIESEIIMKYSMLSERRDSSKHLFKPR